MELGSRELGRLGGVVAAIAVALLLIWSSTAAAAPNGATGKKVHQAVEGLFEKYELPSTIYGVWKKGEPIATGALGEAQPGVPATKADHFKVGNVGESMTVTLLLQFVDQGLVSLDTPISKWFPNLCAGTPCVKERITVGDLARSTSGLVHYAASEAFGEALYANPFRRWSLPEVLGYGLKPDPHFKPGTNWEFSDTNFLLLGRVLSRIGHKPVSRLLEENILDELGMDETQMRGDTFTPAPVMHAYSSERGVYEDVTGWTLNWIRGAGNVITTLGDMRDWATALGTGSLVSKKSHKLQFGRENIGLGPNSETWRYTMGSGITNDWIYNNPHIMGYKGVVSYLPEKDVGIVVIATDGPEGDANTRYDVPIYDAIGELVVPGQPPQLCITPPKDVCAK